MKKNILFLAVATLMSMSAMGERVRPTFSGKTGTFLTGETMYLLHVATNQFYCAGNDYDTHASLSAEQGIPVVFEATDMDNGDGLVVYQLKNYVPKHADWKYAFLQLEEVEETQTYHMYTDNRAQPDIYFCIEEDDEDGRTFRLFGSNANEVCHHSGELANYFVTLDPDYTDKDGNQTGTGIVYADATALPQNWWAVVYADEYEAFQQQLAAYSAAQELAALISEADEYGVDVTDAQKAYDNLSLTEAELKAAYKALLDKVSKYYEENVSPSDPVDMGKYLQNADFETSSEGWSNDSGANTFGLYNTSKWEGFFDGTYLSGENALEVWSASAVSGSVASQTIRNIPNGVYAFTLAMYAQQDGAYVYAGNFKTPVKTGIAIESPQSYAQDYTVLTLVTDNSLQFGYWAEQAAGFWSVMDNARLMYYGTGEEAYAEWVEKSIEQAEDFSDAVCQPALVTAYNGALQDLKDADLDDGEKLMPIVQQYLSSMAAVKANIAKYAQLEQTIYWAQDELDTRDEKEDGIFETYAPKVEDYMSKTAQPALDQHTMGDAEVQAVIDALSNLVNEGKQTYSIYIQMSEMRSFELEGGIEKYGSSCSAEALANAQQLNADVLAYITEGNVQDNEELREWMRKMEEAIKALRIPVKEGTDEDPVDYTYALVNPAFEEGVAGWSNENSIATFEAGTWGLDGDKFSGSAYLNLWSGDAQEPTMYVISQTVENLPNGTYDICAAGFTKVPACFFLFANDDNVEFLSSTTDMDGQYQHVITKVTDGRLKLGVIVYCADQEKPEGSSGFWCTADNFTLFSYGANSTREASGNALADYAVGIREVQGTDAEAARKAPIYNLAGQRMSRLQKGLNIVNGKKVWVR